MPASSNAKDGQSLAMFACPNPDCDGFNQFNTENLSVVEWTGKNKAIRRLYCNRCHCRFSERRGSLMQYTKLPQETVVRLVKCLGYGCSIEATADICEVDPRTVARMLAKAGQRAEDFHRLQLEKIEHPPEAVELDELHGRVCKSPGKKGAARRAASLARRLLGRVVGCWVGTGFMSLWL